MATNTQNCINCKKPILNGIQFCPHCGAKQSHSLSSDELKKNPYKILQVSNDAEIEVVEAAYKSLARKYHPDINSAPYSEDKMKDLNWAREILFDKDKREEWDNFHKEDNPTTSTHSKVNDPTSNYESKQSKDTKKAVKTNHSNAQKVSQPDKELSPSSNSFKPIIVLIVFCVFVLAAYLMTSQPARQPSAQPVRPTPVKVRPTNTPKETVTSSMPNIEYDSEKIISTVNGNGAHYLEEYAKESYESNAFSKPNTVTYTVTFGEPISFYIESAWCALNKEILMQNIEHFSTSISINGQILPNSKLSGFETETQPGEDAEFPEGLKCYSFGIIASDWPIGAHVVIVTMNFDQNINDGYHDYVAGNYITKYNITVTESASSTETSSKILPINTSTKGNTILCKDTLPNVGSKLTCTIEKSYCTYYPNTNEKPTFCHDALYPNHQFTLVAWGSDWSDYDGKCIVINGIVTNYLDKPQIEALNRSQVSLCP